MKLISLAALIALATGDVLVAQGPGGSRGDRSSRGNRQGRSRDRTPTSTADLERAREVLLAAEEPTAEMLNDLITQAVGETRRRPELPSFMADPEATYGEAHMAFRAEIYAPLYDSDKIMQMIRATVCDTNATGFAPSTAALILADRPSLQNLDALWKGYREKGMSRWFTRGIQRNLGRTLYGLRDDPLAAGPRQAILEEVARTASGEVEGDAGPAVEVLFRSGEVDLAISHLDRLLDPNRDPADVLESLAGMSRLLKLEGVDPAIRASALELAKATAIAAMASDSPQGSSLLRTMGKNAIALKNSIDVLRNLARDEEFDFLFACYQHPAAAQLLGIDPLQSLRFSLQGARPNLSPEQRDELDDYFVRDLADVGSRLFDLMEEPMDGDEYQEYLEHRNKRYNAASYVDAICDKDDEFTADLARSGELELFLAAVVSATGVEREGEIGDYLYTGVEEKTETRLICAKLLARFGKITGKPCDEVDLFDAFLEVMIKELHAPDEALEIGRLMKRESTPYLTLEVPYRRPDDQFLLNQTLEGLKMLGYEARRSEGYILVRPEREPSTR